MIQVFKTINGEVVELDSLQNEAWINLVNPTQEEINKVSNVFGIDNESIRAALDEEERARIETEDDYTVILVDVPTIENEDEHEFYATIPLGIILSDNFIITICTKEIPLLNDFKIGKIKSFRTSKKTRFILQLLYKNASYYLHYLRHIDRMSNRIERELHKSLKNKELIQLLDLEKSLVYFSTSLRSNEIVMEKMLRLDSIKKYPDDKELLEDVIIENKQAIEMANIYSNILSGMMDAFASVISNNLNIVMKILTSITIVMAIPTMIASFYGMNVLLPLGNHPYAFGIILGISILLSSISAYIMHKKKMF